MKKSQPTRADATSLLADLIAQASADQDQGLLDWSPKLRQLVERTLGMMGVQGPMRVSLDGLVDLAGEALERTPRNRDHGVYPLVIRDARGVEMHRWFTVDLENVAFGDETYEALVIQLHPE